MKAPDCLWPLGAELGEGPAWSPASATLWFVDIKGCSLHSYRPDSGAQDTWPMPQQPCFVLPTTDGALAVGMSGALHRFDPYSGTLTHKATLEQERPGNRLNDAHVDAAGRLWFGSMDDAELRPSGALYCWNGEAPVRHDDGICITNGPVLSPDGRHLYHTDTLAREIHRFDIDAGGQPRGKRLFLSFDAGQGWPDGNCMDAEGCLWVAFFGGWAIRRYAPDGRLLATVRLPCANATKLCFGDTDLRTAYVTTARKGLGPQERATQPLAGGLFAFSAPAPGLAPHALELAHG